MARSSDAAMSSDDASRPSGDADLTHDAFLGGRLKLWQPVRGYRAATDPVLLAASVQAKPGQHVLELGCGAGAAVLCLGTRLPGLLLHGLEVQPSYAALARRNAAEAGLPLHLHEGDLRTPPATLKQLSFDHVLANPPFFQAARHVGSPDRGRDRAHRETDTALSHWIDTGLRRLKQGGVLSLIQRTERLPELLTALSGRAGHTVVLPLCARAHRPAQRIIVQSRKGTNGPFRILPPLVLHAGAAHLRDEIDYTPEAMALLKGDASLSLLA